MQKAEELVGQQCHQGEDSGDSQSDVGQIEETDRQSQQINQELEQMLSGQNVEIYPVNKNNEQEQKMYAHLSLAFACNGPTKQTDLHTLNGLP